MPLLFGILKRKIKIPIILLNKLALKIFNGRFTEPFSQYYLISFSLIKQFGGIVAALPGIIIADGK